MANDIGGNSYMNKLWIKILFAMKRKVKLYILIFLIPMLTACHKIDKNKTFHTNEVSIALRLHEIDMKLSTESIDKLTHYLTKNDEHALKSMASGEPLDSIAQWYYPTVDALANLLPSIERNDFILAEKGRSGIRNDRSYTSRLRWYVKDRKELHLTKLQIEELLNWCDSIEQSAYDKDSQKQETEKKVLLSLLDDSQIKRYYMKKNKYSAMNETIELLKLMKEKKLYTTNRDSVCLYWQLYCYKLEQKVDCEYLHFISAGKDSIKQNEARLRAFRPLPLWLLDICKPSSRIRMLDILCKRNEIGLTENATKLILTSYVKLLQEEYNHKYNNTQLAQERFNMHQMEKNCIIQSVPSNILDKYFQIITAKEAEKRARKDWNELCEYNLVKLGDSIKVISSIRNYESRLAIANQRTNLNNSRKEKFQKSEIINSKPDLLKRLDEAKRKKRRENIIQF